jgi:hypothetical protein
MTMDEFKEQFKKDFEESRNTNLSFDTTQLEPNNVSDKHKARLRMKLIVASVAVVAVASLTVGGAFALGIFRTEESVKTSNRRYSLNEIRIAESNTFKK